MSLIAQLDEQLKAAVRSSDRQTANAIKMIKTKVMEKRTSKGFSGEIDDDLYLQIISAYKKSLDKAVTQYEAAGERGAANAAELRWDSDFCAQFLPTGLSDDEVTAAVTAAISQLGATDPKMAGRIVGAVMKKHKGLVDANTVKQIAEGLLS